MDTQENFRPVSRAGGLIWILYIVHNPENRILCSHTNFQKHLKKSENTKKSSEYALKWLGENYKNFFIQVAFWMELEIDYFMELFVLKKIKKIGWNHMISTDFWCVIATL